MISNKKISNRKKIEKFTNMWKLNNIPEQATSQRETKAKRNLETDENGTKAW